MQMQNAKMQNIIIQECFMIYHYVTTANPITDHMDLILVVTEQGRGRGYAPTYDDCCLSCVHCLAT